jgi:hypothetical protein
MPLSEAVSRENLDPCVALLLPGARGSARLWQLLARGDASCLEALRQGALWPYVYVRLVQQAPPVSLPPAVVEKLRHAYLVAVQQAARQDAEALQVLRGLVKAGLEVTLLKGADLRLRVYPDPATRPMADLDILVSPEQAGPARSFLRALGYRPLEADPRPGFRERFAHAEGLRPPSGLSLYVDLHWEIREGHGYYRLPYEVVKPLLQEVRLQNLPLKVLAPEHLLLHLCLHTCFEFSGWRQFLDLALASRQLPVDWEQFARAVRACRCQVPVCRVLEVGQGLQPDLVPSPGALGLRGISSGPAERLVATGTWGPLLPYLAFFTHHSWRDWLPFLSAKLWPDRQYLMAKFGSASRGGYLRQFIRKWPDRPTP